MNLQSRLRVLVVDDDPHARSITRDVLESQYDVVEAENALDALRRIEALAPDLALIDFVMPDLDGVELTRRLRQNPRTRDVCIIMLTAFSDSAHQARALSSGCDGIISKPYNVNDLLRIVAAHLRERQLAG